MMHIGSLAQQAGTTTRTVRYYEEMGLIKPECRTPGGFRCYCQDQLSRLHTILSLKEMGFDLERIKVILDKRKNNGTGGELAESILDDLSHRLEEVTGQIRHYQQLEGKLRRAIDSVCRCRPCELRLEERFCPDCHVLNDEPKETIPFFHTIPQN